jgi:hypothetical protein
MERATQKALAEARAALAKKYPSLKYSKVMDLAIGGASGQK